MSLNEENVGIPIAMIINKSTTKKGQSKGHTIISVSDYNQKVSNPKSDIKLNDENQRFQVVGDPKSERDIIYVTGRSGSGKSYFIKDYVINYYKKIHKNNPVFLFSALKDDKTIDEIPKLIRINLNNEFANDDDITVKDFEDSCIIFDDTDTLKNKIVLAKVNHLLNECLQVGRHYKITCLITKHTACNSNDTKIILAESHQFVVFPQGLGNKSLKYLLDNYLGLDNSQIKKIKNQNSRWVAINRRTFPLSVVSEKECFILSNNDEEENKHIIL